MKLVQSFPGFKDPDIQSVMVGSCKKNKVLTFDDKYESSDSQLFRFRD